jgi:hypothetical protein
MITSGQLKRLKRNSKIIKQYKGLIDKGYTKYKACEEIAYQWELTVMRVYQVVSKNNIEDETSHSLRNH